MLKIIVIGIAIIGGASMFASSRLTEQQDLHSVPSGVVLGATASMSARNPPQININVQGSNGLINHAPNVVTNIFQVEEGTLFFDHVQADMAKSYVPSPVINTSVDMQVSGVVERTRVTQTFVNPSSEWVDATYVFPVPVGAAVDELLMTIGSRHIEGQIQIKEQAIKTFNQAKQAGKKASLVLQKRPNLFTNQIANIGPNERIEISITYQNTAQYADGEYSVRFPMTLSQRYAVTAESVSDTAGKIAGVDAIDTSDMKQHEVDFVLRLDTQSNSTQIHSTTHAIESQAIEPGVYEVMLSQDTIANKDLVIKWRSAQDNEPVVAHYQQQVGDAVYGLVHIVPPQTIPELQPKHTIFVLDSSGSMHGTALTQAVQAIRVGLTQLNEVDSFNIVDFDSDARALWKGAKIANWEHLQEAQTFLANVDSDGGTNIADALQLSLTTLTGPDEQLTQVIFITDGSIDNEAALIEQIAGSIGQRRLFTVGIGAAPNAFFMEYAAMIGKGTFTYIDNVDDVQSTMTRLFDKLNHPALTNLQLTLRDESKLEALKSIEVYPKVLPDIYLGEPIVLSYRYAGYLDTMSSDLEELLVTGQMLVAGEAKSIQLPLTVNLIGSDPNTFSLFGSDPNYHAKGLNKLWARAKIKEITTWPFTNTEYLPENLASMMQNQITETALAAKIVSKYTALVAVDVTATKPIDTQSKAVDVANAKAAHLSRQHQARRQLQGQLPQTATPMGLLWVLGWIGVLGLVAHFAMNGVPLKGRK
ncbi:MAG: marine proteobacterial sortase target protein [Glaciecola sp.]|nr:marine proteobacterial sortase target protein [Glaciecola sp.]